MILAHKIRLIPTKSDREYLKKCCGVSRFTYNWGLNRWNEAYHNGEKPTGLKLKKEFNGIKKKEYPWIYEVTKTASEQPFSDLSTAFKSFFTGQAKHPQFKKKGKSNDSFYISNDKFTLDRKRVRIPKLGWVKMREELRFGGKITSSTVSRVAGEWYISISVETHDRYCYKPVENQDCVGVDLGIKQLATLSNGEVINGPKPLRKLKNKIRRLSKSLSRKKLGSKNREKAKKKLAKLHHHVYCVRNDSLHKLTHHLAKNFTNIAIEDLNVKGMVQNKKLAKAIVDMGFGEFRRQLKYKAQLHFSNVAVVDRFFPSSKLCSSCANVKQDLKLSDRTYNCATCGFIIDRDLNASVNILQGAFGKK